MTFSPAERASRRNAGEVDPASAALHRLIAGGYRFLHPRDSNGELAAVVGVRPHGSVIDVVRIEGEHEVVASRVPGDEQDVLNPRQPCWQRTGPLDEVVDDLLALADGAYAPGVAASGEQLTGCWVPASPARSTFLVAS